MFKRSTTLVLGAGASKPFGFPLAKDLYRTIVNDIEHVENEVRDQWLGAPQIGASNATFFNEKPTLALMSYLFSPLSEPYRPADLGNPYDALVAFRREFVAQTQESVDRFIGDNPRHQFIGKCLLALHVVTKMYRMTNGRLVLHDFSNRQYGERRSWYHLLINYMREGAADAEALKDNKLNIVTFNYETSLEMALDRNFGNTEKHKGANWRDCATVHHINGAVGTTPERLSDVGKFILDCAQRIHLVDEEPHPDIMKVRMAARDVIAASDRIFIIGFHMDPSNVEAIGLTRQAANQNRVFCLNFDGHPLVDQQAMQLRILPTHIKSNGPGRQLHIDEAIDQGLFRN